MSDLISRQSAIDAVNEFFKLYAINRTMSNVTSIQDILRQLPSVQPEIIRCKDCEHWDKTWTNDWSPDYHYCPMIDGVRKSDFYCADAERRTDG